MAFDPLARVTEAGERAALTVSQVNRSIGEALADAFPDPFWVVGELQGYERDAGKAAQRRWGQVYFELVEKEEGSDAAKASAKALMWGDAARRITQRLAEAGGDLRLADGLKIKVLCAVDFYWPRASLQLKVLDVDPRFTLGDMEKARRDLIEKLKREGVFDDNRNVPLPRAPRTVGLITSDGSAAFHDFVREMTDSGYGFDVRLVDTRMQGEETEAGVLRALALLEADPAVEVIALVRGGGSRSDLLWFDREKIAFAVAGCAKPVLTGIGHEIDLSVTDLVAHAAHKTPTACAAFLAERVRQFESCVGQAAAKLSTEARRRMAELSRLLSDAVTNWRHLTAARLKGAAADLSAAGAALAAGARGHAAVRRERLAGAVPRLAQAARRSFAARRERLAAFEKELELKDPRRLLARGYSLLFAGGRLVKSAAVLAEGDEIEARLKDGAAQARVTTVRKDVP